MLIGVVVALRWEARCLQKVLVKDSTTIRWQLTGMGPSAAAAGAQALIEQGANVLLSYGCAAGLQPGLTAGTLLLPQKIVTADGSHLLCDQHWWQRFSSQLTDACHAPLAETATVLTSCSAKKTLAADTQASATDMESAMVMRIAAQHKVPALVTRAILDDSEQTLPAGLIECCDSYAQPKILRLAGWLAAKPVRMQAMFKLARAQQQACQTLATVAQTLERME